MQPNSTKTETLPLYIVFADRITGRWVTEPRRTDFNVRASLWHTLQDTPDYHFDTFERDDETCALTVSFVPPTH